MSETDREQAAPAIKVVDRRRFNAEGQIRPEAASMADRPRTRSAPAEARPGQPGQPSQMPGRPGSSEPPAQPAARRAAPPPAALATQAAEEPEPRLEFLPFIASLATNALAALGVLPEGQGGAMPKNPHVAREYIDIIVMLERRTRGNLTPEEAQTMTQLIADLRLQFVEATRSVQPARGLGGPGGAGFGVPGQTGF